VVGGWWGSLQLQRRHIPRRACRDFIVAGRRLMSGPRPRSRLIRRRRYFQGRERINFQPRGLCDSADDRDFRTGLFTITDVGVNHEDTNGSTVDRLSAIGDRFVYARSLSSPRSPELAGETKLPKTRSSRLGYSEPSVACEMTISRHNNYGISVVSVAATLVSRHTRSDLEPGGRVRKSWPP
jgi:hypothetical protein